MSFALTHLIGFGAVPAAAVGGTLQTTFSTTLTHDTGATGALTFVQLIDAARRTVAGGTSIIVRFNASSSGSYTITDAFVGLKAAAGDAYDFATTPTRLTFSGGSNGFTISAGASIESDEITFSDDITKDLLISWYNTTNTQQRYIPFAFWADPDGFYYGPSTNDASTVDKSSYVQYQGIGIIDRIRVRA